MNIDKNKKIIFSMDVEQDIQDSYGDKSTNEVIPKVIEIFKKNNIFGEFFISSDILVKSNSIGLSLADNGHSVGNHNLIHWHLNKFPHKSQKEQLETSTEIFRMIMGNSPKTFRAPNFSANHDTISILDSLNYLIDSSVFPSWKKRNKFMIYRDLFPNAIKVPYHPSKENFLIQGDMKILEVPVSRNPLCRNCPIGGGGLLKFGRDKMINVIDRHPEDVVVLLFHPWELLPNHIKNNDEEEIFKKFNFFISELSDKYDFILFENLLD